MKKLKGLIKYELINIKRGLLIWIAIALFIFGWQQIISNGLYPDHTLCFYKIIASSWLPINLIILPLMILNMKISNEENEIFNTIDLNSTCKFLGKFLPGLFINVLFIIFSIIIMIVLYFICNINYNYFIYNFKDILLYFCLMMFFCNISGVLIGILSRKYFGEIIGLVILAILFVLTCNFYKECNLLVPLMSFKCMPSPLELFSHDRLYSYHNYFWLSTIILLFVITYLFFTCNNIFKNKLKVLCSLIIIVPLTIISIYSSVKVYCTPPIFYNYATRASIINSQKTNEITTFVNRTEDFNITSYDMDITIDKKDILKNNCNINIITNKDNISIIEFGLYKYLKVTSAYIDNTSVKFTRTNNIIKLTLPLKVKKNQKVTLKLCYEGNINTNYMQGRPLFYANHNAMYLGENFEWYPKLNDCKVKDYNVKFKRSDNSNDYKVYSNINSTKENNTWVFKGSSKNISLISSIILSEKTYSGINFIGNVEQLTDNECKANIESLSTLLDMSKIKTIIFVPFTQDDYDDKQGYPIYMYEDVILLDSTYFL